MAKLRPRSEKSGKHNNDRDGGGAADPANDNDRSSEASSDLVSDSTGSADDADDAPPTAPPARAQHQQLSIGGIGR
jgi:hypothetical protein